MNPRGSTAYGSSFAAAAVRFKAAVIGAPMINRLSLIGTSDMPAYMAWQAGGANPWTRAGESNAHPT